jgi:hypothetical protein
MVKLTEKGEEILGEILDARYDVLRSAHLRSCPGCSENDIEREFLSDICKDVLGVITPGIADMIDQIR